MTRWTAFLLTLLVTAAAGTPAAVPQADTAEQTRALRQQIEQRFDIVPLTDAVGLRPKSRIRDVRLIEIAADGAITINGQPVTGGELRSRLGADAEPVMRLSFLDAATRRALATPPAPPPAVVEPPREPQRVEPAEPVEAPREPEPRSRIRRSDGDRVRVFGSVNVAADEVVSGQVVAVLGSVRIDGEVGDQVVAVMGAVDLGPKAVVRGDVVSVGGRVRRAEGARVTGSVTEVAMTEAGIPIRANWPDQWWGPMWMLGGFGAGQRLIGTGFRLVLLLLLAALAFVVARPTIESAAARLTEAPVQATFVGIASQVLLIPILAITVVVLAISIIGIPLLLLLPFVVLMLLLMALFGFTGTSYAVGQWARRRFGIVGSDGFGDVALGLFLILLPLIVGRLIGLGGGLAGPLAFLLVAAGLLVEFVAWTSGFGAVLTNSVSRWQARRASRHPVAPVAP